MTSRSVLAVSKRIEQESGVGLWALHGRELGTKEYQARSKPAPGYHLSTHSDVTLFVVDIHAMLLLDLASSCPAGVNAALSA